MEHIIQQIALELVEKVVKKSLSSQIHDIDALAADVELDCKCAAKGIVEAVVSELNRCIREDKQGRKAQGLVIKEKDRPRRLHTKIGILDLKRDYFYVKSESKYEAILDQMLGIKQYERIGRHLSADMVNLASDMSYAKSASIASGTEISRQTVRNHILKLHPPVHEAAETGKQVNELHVYADEDHVHMQKPGKEKGKRNQIVPLVTVTEGIKHVGNTRKQTINKVHFVDERFNPKTLWKEVEGYIDKVYDIENIEHIYLHGDGGNWIKNGLESFSQTVHVMDGYHYEKALKPLTRAFPDNNVRIVLDNAIKENDPQKAEGYLERLLRSSSEKQAKCLKEFRKYLFNNWEAIRNLKTLDIPGSCTEAQVSHVLSDRFSRDPLGWSKEGLGKLSCIRVYRENGQNIVAEDFDTVKATDIYLKYADQVIKESITGEFDWSIFDREPVIYDKASGTQILLDAIGRDYGVFKS